MSSPTTQRVAIVCTLIAGGMLAVHQFLPVQTSAQFVQAKKRQYDQTREKISEGKAKVKEIRDANTDRLWSNTPSEVSTEAMAMVANAAKSLNVTISSFRPQRPMQEGVVQILPFDAVVSGRFAAITALCSAIDSPAKKLALESIQINAADPNNETVTASIGLVAYVYVEEPEEK